MSSAAQDWRPELDELARRTALARQMGGAEKVARQHVQGKLDVRQRIGQLLDEDSFHEIGALSGRAGYDEHGRLHDFMPANFLFGRGRIDGRPVVVGADDFSIRGGAADGGIRDKTLMAERMAFEWRMPIVRLIDGTGGGGSVKSIESEGRTYVPAVQGWHQMVMNLGAVPVVSLLLGSVAGFGAGRAVNSHYSLMVKDTAQMFTAGPPVVERIGEQLSKNQLGGSEVHARNGSIDDEVASEAEAFERARRFLSYLPSSVHELPPRGPVHDDAQRREARLLGIVPRDRRRAYRMRSIIDDVVDRGSFFEIGKGYGRSLICGLARLDGWPVALMAGDPFYDGGALSALAAQKMTRHIDLAQTFHLPMVHLVDCPGFKIGLEAEQAATLRHGARAMAAVCQATVPWCSVIVRKVYGVAGGAHQNSARCNLRYAWPSGDWGSLPLEGGIEVAYKAELAQAEDPQQMVREIGERIERMRSPFRTAEAFRIEEIIDPRDTRPLLVDFAHRALRVLEPGPSTSWCRP